MNAIHEQLLISRAVDGDATDGEWTQLETLAAARPQLWRELAHAQRDQSALTRAVAHAGHVAQRIDLGALDVPHSIRAVPTLRLNRFGAWTGWMVAAIVMLVATTQLQQNTGTLGPAVTSPKQASIVPFASSADAFQAYLQKGLESGDVIGEVPTKVLLDTRAAPSGDGYEVVYLRQVMERVIVPDLYQVRGQNEQGQPTLTRYSRTARSSM